MGKAPSSPGNDLEEAGLITVGHRSSVISMNGFPLTVRGMAWASVLGSPLFMMSLPWLGSC